MLANIFLQQLLRKPTLIPNSKGAHLGRAARCDILLPIVSALMIAVIVVFAVEAASVVVFRGPQVAGLAILLERAVVTSLRVAPGHTVLDLVLSSILVRASPIVRGNTEYLQSCGVIRTTCRPCRVQSPRSLGSDQCYESR